MKNTLVRAARTSSSTWETSVRKRFGVRQFQLELPESVRLVRDHDVESVFVGVREAVEVLELGGCPAPDGLAEVLGEVARDPVTCSDAIPSSDSAARRLIAITDFPVPGPPRIRNTVRESADAASRTRVSTALNDTRCSSSSSHTRSFLMAWAV